MMTQHSLDEESAKLRNDARETSRLAALMIAPRSASGRYKVLQAIVSAGSTGFTDDEVCDHIDMSPNTERPRRLELVEGGWIVDSGDKRESFYGNPAIVWRATSKAILLIEDKHGSQN